jgi:hypothetical protein
MAIDKEYLKKMFPNLYRELEEGEAKIPIDAVRKNAQEAETEDENAEVAAKEFDPELTTMPDKLRHFNPDAVDFIRRCDTEAQAEEIIDYLQKKGEITNAYAEELLCKLRRDGLRSFGAKKEENYYFKEGGIF